MKNERDNALEQAILDDFFSKKFRPYGQPNGVIPDDAEPDSDFTPYQHAPASKPPRWMRRQKKGYSGTSRRPQTRFKSDGFKIL